MPTHDDLKAMNQSLGTLYDTLKNALFATPTTEGQDRIQASIDVVRRAMQSIDELDLAAADRNLTGLNADLKAATKDLTDLKQKLEGIVEDVGAVTEAISAIDGALTAAGKILPVVLGA